MGGTAVLIIQQMSDQEELQGGRNIKVQNPFLIERQILPPANPSNNDFTHDQGKKDSV